MAIPLHVIPVAVLRRDGAGRDLQILDHRDGMPPVQQLRPRDYLDEDVDEVYYLGRLFRQRREVGVRGLPVYRYQGFHHIFRENRKWRRSLRTAVPPKVLRSSNWTEPGEQHTPQIPAWRGRTIKLYLAGLQRPMNISSCKRVARSISDGDTEEYQLSTETWYLNGAKSVLPEDGKVRVPVRDPGFLGKLYDRFEWMSKTESEKMNALVSDEELVNHLKIKALYLPRTPLLARHLVIRAEKYIQQRELKMTKARQYQMIVHATSVAMQPDLLEEWSAAKHCPGFFQDLSHFLVLGRSVLRTLI